MINRFKINMMKSIFGYLLAGIILLPFLSCEVNLMEEEHYKKVIYLKSGDNNIVGYPHAMNDSITTGYIVVGSGGSMPFTEDQPVTLEMDFEALERYNFRNFGNDVNKYYRLLPPTRYTIPSFEVRIKAGEPSATAAFPIEIDINGLSPDSIYIVPMRIASAKGVETNEDKDFVLYQIHPVNNYSNMTSRSYQMRGMKQPDGSVPSTITTTKVVSPIAHNQVRVFVENLTTDVTLDAINARSIVLTINEDNSVRIKPYRTIEVEQTGECTYDPEERMFTLNYRYRLAGATTWITVYEELKRMGK